MRRPATWAPLGWLAAAAIFCALPAALGLRLNLTPSLPLGLYRFTSGQPIEVGSLVAACLPPAIGAAGRERRALRRGSCPGGFSPVLKIVGAAGGDLVTVSNHSVRVNGRPLQGSAPHVDRRGELMERLPPGDYRLTPGELWLYAPHPRSWDSRYFGPVLRSSVIAAVRPVPLPFVFPSSGPHGSPLR